MGRFSARRQTALQARETKEGAEAAKQSAGKRAARRGAEPPLSAEAPPVWREWLMPGIGVGLVLLMIGYTARPKGFLHVDAGARRAVEEKGRSLLPIGVVRVQGEFGKGDVVGVLDPDGAEFARGLVNYSSADAERVKGNTTEQLRAELGRVPYVEIVHRDNLVILE